MPAEPATPRPAARRQLFTATIFVGSFLLFLIQPMIARLALPRLGGAPAVWNSAMLVYQALLLAGYAYAHWLTRLKPRTQGLVHLGLALAAAAFLPIGLAGTAPSAGASAFLWVPWLLTASIGPLFLLVSANSPLLQRWFSLSGGGDPFPLFAASNFGSFAGLLSYPLLLEPFMRVSDQRWLWTGGYALLVVMLVACVAALWPSGNVAPARETSETPTLRQLGWWTWLAFVPSGLMLATTLFITTDVMPMPLLWVLPLGLYLLSFTVAFAARGAVAGFVALLAPYTLLPAAIAMFVGQALALSVVVAILLVALFAISVACHLKIYESRPAPSQLTHFYLAIAFGGALGGVFCALLAPLLFDWFYEFPLLLIAAAITLLPGYSLIVAPNWLRARQRAIVAAGLSAVILIAAIAVAATFGRTDETVRYGALVALVIGPFAVGSRMLLVSMIAAAMIVAGIGQKFKLSLEPDRMFRTYFGVYSILDRDNSRQLLHGTTLHGTQLTTPGGERVPTTYYAAGSGVGRAMHAAPLLFGAQARVSVVGLGAGTLACYKQPQQRWTFFELDPAVARLAASSGQFTFLPRCAPDARVVIGDARLNIAQSPPASADVLVVDAFSSDAVPMHLLTQEAFAAYGRHLRPAGLLLMHISNRHLDLEPVVTGAPGWTARVGAYNPPPNDQHLAASTWVALSRSPATLAALSRSGDGFWVPPSQPKLLWTDDYGSLLSVLK